MDKERVKFIIKNIEILVDCLKKEFDENNDSEEGINVTPFEEDYDEVFSE